MNEGKTIGHYNMLRLLGKGGMGEVYLATDTRLDRQVAVKALPERLRRDPERLARFRREAKAAASLKHPNIAVIHALEEFDDYLLITMEYVEGQSLKDVIPSDGMALDAFFATFIPLADALAHAHGQGRIHRDLKPGNIMIAKDGTPKILDFGLARIIDPDSVGGTHEESRTTPEIDPDAPTRTMKPEEHKAAAQGVPSLTRGGQLMGTPQYMSPEQAEREETDARTDLFSFGVVMYEALTGQRPFEGKTLESLIGRILTEEPKSITALKPITPYTLWSVIRKCLVKDRARRMQTAREMHTELEVVQQEVQAGTVLVDARMVATGSLPFWRQPVAIGLAALFVAAAALAGWLLKPVPEPPLRKFTIPVSATFAEPTISPDGTMVAYINTPGGTLWVRDLHQLEPREIPNTEGALSPFWSPGSDYIGYFTQNELRKVVALGGPSTTLSRLSGSSLGAAWKPDGTILVSWPSGVVTVSAQGGEAVKYLRADSTKGERWYASPHVLPDGQTVIFARGNLDTSYDIIVQDGDTRRSLVHSNPGEFLWRPVYAPPGHILYHRLTEDRHIWAIPFNLSSRTHTGDPILVAENAAFPSVSNDGTLVYQSASANPGQELVWVDRNGKVTGTIGQPQGAILHPALSPDRRRVAAGSGGDIWLHEVDRPIATRLTVNPATEGNPAWSPDGTRLVFYSLQGAKADLYVKAADGGEERPLVAGPLEEYILDWSPDGRYIAYHTLDRQNYIRRDLWYAAVSSGASGPVAGEPVAFTQTPSFNEAGAQFSPDGRYLAYQSDETGRQEVYIRAFPAGAERIRVSVAGGVHPRWSGDGTELFYVEGDRMMASRITIRPRLDAETPAPLFTAGEANVVLTPLSNPLYSLIYDVAADGRFVMVRNVTPETSSAVTVVQNWAREFEDRE